MAVYGHKKPVKSHERVNKSHKFTGFSNFKTFYGTSLVILSILLAFTAILPTVLIFNNSYGCKFLALASLRPLKP
jgi:hypothetical protein